jgi:hypothetical protein
MDVKAIRYRYQSDAVLGPGKKGEIRKVEAVRVEFCCDRMREAWGTFVGFGSLDGLLNQNEAVNLFAGDIRGPEEMAICFCPFCAQPIRISVDDETPGTLNGF